MNGHHFELRAVGYASLEVVRVEGPASAATRSAFERTLRGWDPVRCPACGRWLDPCGDCGAPGCLGADDESFGEGGDDA